MGKTRLIKRDSPGSELFSSFPRTQPDQNTNNLHATSWPSPTPEETPSAAPSLTREAESSATSAVASETRAPTSTAAHTPEPTPTKTATNTVTPKPTETKTPTPVPELPPRIVEMPWGPVNLNVSPEEAKANYEAFLAYRKTWNGHVALVDNVDINDWWNQVNRNYDKSRTALLADVQYVQITKVDSEFVPPPPALSRLNPTLAVQAIWLKADGSTKRVMGFVEQGVEIAVNMPAKSGRSPSFVLTNEVVTKPEDLRVGEIYALVGYSVLNLDRNGIGVTREVGTKFGVFVSR